MTRIRVESFTISLDGYGAGPNQDVNNPLGLGGTDLHKWAFPTRTFQQALFGKDSGTTGVDDDFATRGFQNVGAWILGRNMFGPIRGPWPNEDWKGWWGDNPPYHVPVFVLTHHARPSIVMEGGTTFHFITGGIHEALARAREAANGKDVRIGGGRIPYSSTSGHPSLMSCMSPSPPFFWGKVNVSSKTWTCDRWDTNARSSWGPKTSPMLYSDARSNMTPNRLGAGV